MGYKINDVRFELPDVDALDVRKDRHCRYFNILWFRHNFITSARRLTFGQMVAEKMDNMRYRMTVLKHPTKYEFRFWALDENGKINKCFFNKPYKPIFISKKGYVLNIQKAKCESNEFLYAAALKLKLMDTPKKWVSLMHVGQVDWATATWKYNNETGVEVIEFWDAVHNHVKVPMALMLNDFMHFGTAYNHMKNLKQFKKLTTEKQRKSFKRCVKKLAKTIKLNQCAVPKLTPRQKLERAKNGADNSDYQIS